MKILHVLDHSLPIHSGYSFRTAEILAEQEKLGMSVIAVTGPKHDYHRGQHREATQFPYERTTYPRFSLASAPLVGQVEVVRAIYCRVRQILRHCDIDIVHAHSPALNGIGAIRAAAEFSLPVVYEMRASWEDAAVNHGVTRAGSMRYRLSRMLESYVFRNADAITTICEGLKKEIVSRGIDEGIVTIIPNAVDPDKFAARQSDVSILRDQYGVQGEFVAAFCGSFYAYEGLDMLLEALPGLRRSGLNISLILAGGGEEEERLRSLAKSLGVAEQVSFPGRVSQDAVVDIYSIADVCVYPRRQMKLTEMVTPLKPLEAMAAGGIVLASDVGGHKELIENGVNGFLFAAESIDSLQMCIRRIADLEETVTISKAARNFVVAERTWRSSVARYVDVYNDVASRRSQA